MTNFGVIVIVTVGLYVIALLQLALQAPVGLVIGAVVLALAFTVVSIVVGKSSSWRI